jgi:hypothetical protein
MDVHEKLSHEILKTLQLSADELYQNHADLWTTEKEIVVVAPLPSPTRPLAPASLFHSRLVALPCFLRHEVDAITGIRGRYYFEMPLTVEVAHCVAVRAFEQELERSDEREAQRIPEAS